MYQWVKNIIIVSTFACITTACTVADKDKEAIQGQLNYQDTIKLPPSAQITVQLLDTSVPNAPAKLVSGQTFLADGKQVPIDFNLNYETDLIHKDHHYMVVADVKVKNKLIFRTAQTYMVLTDKDKTQQIELLLKRN